MLSVSEEVRSGVVNVVSAWMARNPYPVYAILRAKAPVHRSRLLKAWVFTRHADVDSILRDHRRFGNDPRKGILPARQQAMLPPSDEFSMLVLDPPDHTRLRAVVNQAFSPKAVNAFEPRIRRILGNLLDDIDDPAAFDFMEAVARPLPVIVIAEMLGVPTEDRAQFKGWAAQRARLLEPTVSRREGEAGKAVSGAYDAYFRPILKERRASPRDDLVSALVRAQDGGELRSERETLNMLRLLLAAGSETATNLIGNGILALLRHPDQLQRLREAPSLIPGAVEELLRFDAPVQADVRRVLADCEVNGFPLRKRDTVVLLLGAANRDPEVFDHPDRLDVERRPVPHLSFGSGIHHCLGAPLARLQGRIVLEMLLARFRSMNLLGDRPRFGKSILFRSLESLPLQCVLA